MVLTQSLYFSIARFSVSSQERFLPFIFFTLEIQVVLGFPCGRAQLGNPYLNATLTGISSGALAIFTNHVNPLTVNFFFHSTIFVSRKDLHF